MADSFLLSSADYRRVAAVLQWAERRMQIEQRPPTGPAPVAVGTLRRFALTAKDPNDGTYPKPEDKPNTYWVKWQSATWNLAADPKDGAKARTLTWLSALPKIEDDETDGYGVAHHYADRGPANAHYVPEGTLVLCSWHNDRWWFCHSRVTFVAALGAAALETPGNTKRWTYPFIEQVKTGDGYDEWAALVGGRTGTCRNTVEVPNTSATLVEPATAGALVEMWEEHYIKAGVATTEYWFQWENADKWPQDSDGSDGSGGGGGVGTTLDVVVCDPWNRCGNYIVFPQRRIHFPPGVWIETLADTAVPIYQCQSSGGDDDDESLGESSGTDDCLSCLRVSGKLTPDATGDYYPLGYRIGGRCVWKQFGTSYYIVWNPTSNSWLLLDIDVGPGGGEYWIKSGGGPMGNYDAGPNVTGVATVGTCGVVQ